MPKTNTTSAVTSAPADFPLSPTEMGSLTGAVLGGIIVFLYVISKFKKDHSVNNSEGNLYKNLSDRIEVISNTLIRVESERETLMKQSHKNELRIVELEKHEIENRKLRNMIAEKDKIIETLQEINRKKELEVADLQKRIQELETQMKSRFVDCKMCDHKRLTFEMTRATDVTPADTTTINLPFVEDEL